MIDDFRRRDGLSVVNGRLLHATAEALAVLFGSFAHSTNSAPARGSPNDRKFVFNYHSFRTAQIVVQVVRVVAL